MIADKHLRHLQTIYLQCDLRKRLNSLWVIYLILENVNKIFNTPFHAVLTGKTFIWKCNMFSSYPSRAWYKIITRQCSAMNIAVYNLDSDLVREKRGSKQSKLW